MIFCVEDDQSIRDLMEYALRSVGFETRGFSNGRELDEALRETTPELILLDILLPGEDGISILKRLRADPRTAKLPIIMASARDAEFDKVVGLDAGADDYLAKPFGMMEMISRVKAVLRRSASAPLDQLWQLGAITLNPASRTVTANGKSVSLTLKEYELLALFMTNVGIVFSREKLLFAVWGAEYAGETRTVDVHIGSLRAKLGECGGHIKTVRGVGYKMEEER